MSFHVVDIAVSMLLKNKPCGG